MNKTPSILFVIEMLMVLVCIRQLQMGQTESKSNRITTIVSIAGLIVAILAIFAYLYIDSPSGFTVKVYPNTQLDFCTEGSQLVFDQASGFVPGYSYSNSYGSGFFISSLAVNTNDSTFEFGENVSVTDLDGPWWAFGHVVKPYRSQVTLIVENGPPGINIAFANASFSVAMQDNSKIADVPPFDANIILKIARNTTLALGPHYITIKAMGQDGETKTCECVLMVNKFCKHRVIAVER